MADDVTYTSTNPAGVPDATKQATDEHATRGHMPIVKLAYSADGDATHIPADAGGLLVNLGANNDVVVSATDLDIRNLVSTDVVTAELSATDNAVLDAIAASVAAIDTDTTTLIGHVDGLETSNSAIQTAVELIDDTVAVLGTTTYTETTTKGLTIGAVRRDADTTLVGTTNEIGPLQMDANGRLKVEAFSGETLPVSLTSTTITGTVAVTQSGTWDEVGINDSGNSITVDAAAGGLIIGDGTNPVVVLTDGADNVSNANNQLVTAGLTYAYDGTAWDRVTIGGGTEATAMRVTVASDSTGVLSVDDNSSSLSVDWNGTQPVTGSGTATGALRVELANNGTGLLSTVSTVTTVSTLTGGNIAHDSGDSGNPHKIGAKAVSSTEGVTLVTANDRTDLYADLDGILVVKQSCTNDDVVSERVTNTDGASTAFTNFGAVASTHNCISAITVYNSSAGGGFIDFRDGTGGSVLWTMPVPAGGGSVISCGNQPFLFRTSQNTALAFDPSGAITTLYISVSGYQSKS